MSRTTIDRLIINSPDEEPARHWHYDRETRFFSLAEGRRLGFEVLYVYRGVVYKYRPDFLIRLVSGEMLVLETTGQDTEQDRVKRQSLDEWAKAVNVHGGFGRWRASRVRTSARCCTARKAGTLEPKGTGQE